MARGEEGGGEPSSGIPEPRSKFTGEGMGRQLNRSERRDASRMHKWSFETHPTTRFFANQTRPVFRSLRTSFTTRLGLNKLIVAHGPFLARPLIKQRFKQVHAIKRTSVLPVRPIGRDKPLNLVYSQSFELG